MKLPRTSWLKAMTTVAVYGVIGLVFYEERRWVSALFWGLCVLRLSLLYRERQRCADMPELGEGSR